MPRAALQFVRPLLLTACLFHAAAAFAAGPVYLQESGSSLVLGNDYLERTISLAEGQTGTTRFVNKISGRAYSLGGPEFAVKLITERVGYDFGDENPKVITARSLRLLDHAAEDLPGGVKRYDSIGSAPVDEDRAELRDSGRGTFDWGV